MLNKICCDLEVSRKLKELGIEGETDFCYTCINKSTDSHYYLQFWNNQGWKRNDGNYGHWIPSYTFEQIIEMLPHDYPIDDDKEITITANKEITITANRLKKIASMVSVEIKEDDNLATTAARLLIKLKQDKIGNYILN